MNAPWVMTTTQAALPEIFHVGVMKVKSRVKPAFLPPVHTWYVQENLVRVRPTPTITICIYLFGEAKYY